ncbi:MAG: aspartate kinase [Anaerolineae bacterium]|nr:aspartate kinase [Anaerolineae bacterium]
MHTITMKFGGTSVGSVEAIQQVGAIITRQAEAGQRVVTVVSAMSGVTNALIRAAQDSEMGDVGSYKRLAHELRRRHAEAANALVQTTNRRERLLDEIRDLLDDFEQLCHGISILREVTPRGMDVVSSLGERLSARLVAAYLQDTGAEAEAVDATTLIVTNDRFQNATPDMAATRLKVQAKLKRMMERGILPIITGFIGATPNGTITTLGRGGSDYSAGIIAAALPSDELWIWSDVDGVMTTDPRISDQARTIRVLGYGEVSEMAYFGAKVLHPRTILPVIELNIPIRVLNTFNPAHPGTLIRPEPEIVPGAIKAITTVTAVHLMTVQGRGMVGVPGIAGRTFSAVARAGASMLMFAQSSSEQSFCFVVPDRSSSLVKDVIEQELALERARRDVDDVQVSEDVVIVTVVGAGMRGTPGVAARVFTALGEAEVNVLSIAQGASEYSISMVVAHADATKAVQALHGLLQNGNGNHPTRSGAGLKNSLPPGQA